MKSKLTSLSNEMEKTAITMVKSSKLFLTDSITITFNDENGVSMKVFTVYRDGSYDA